MKTKRILIIMGIMAGIIISFNMVCTVLDTFFYSIDDLPQGKLIEELQSPDGDNTVSVYLVDNALGTAVRCSVDDGNGERNVYWKTDISEAEVSWVDEESFLINGVTLNVDGGTYDSRDINEELDMFLNQKLF